jgi:outer membrane protein
MNRIVRAAIASLCMFAAVAHAQDVGVGTVDMRKVLNESKAGKRAKAEMEKMIKERQEALAREEKHLESLQQAYEKEKLLLSDAQKQAKQKEFDAKLKAFQQSAASAQREVQKQEADFIQKALPEARAVIADVAKQQKLAVVFERNEAGILYSSANDITDEVIKRLDAKTGGQ